MRTAATAWCFSNSEEYNAARPGSLLDGQERWNPGLGLAEKFWGSGPVLWMDLDDTVCSAAVTVIGLSADRQGYAFGRIPVKILRAQKPGFSDQLTSSLDGGQLRLRCQVCPNHASSCDEAGSSEDVARGGKAIKRVGLAG